MINNVAIMRNKVIVLINKITTMRKSITLKLSYELNKVINAMTKK